jgi:S1-C subfamily serine protease
MKLGDSGALQESARVLVSGFGGAEAARPALVVSRRSFAGYWEYLLEEAIFTAPPYENFGGAALIGPEGELLGIGSLVVGDAMRGERTVPGNMFVPIDILKPILPDMLRSMIGLSPQWKTCIASCGRRVRQAWKCNCSCYVMRSCCQ